MVCWRVGVVFLMRCHAQSEVFLRVHALSEMSRSAFANRVFGFPPSCVSASLSFSCECGKRHWEPVGMRALPFFLFPLFPSFLSLVLTRLCLRLAAEADENLDIYSAFEYHAASSRVELSLLLCDTSGERCFSFSQPTEEDLSFCFLSAAVRKVEGMMLWFEKEVLALSSSNFFAWKCPYIFKTEHAPSLNGDEEKYAQAAGNSCQWKWRGTITENGNLKSTVRQRLERL